MKKMTINGTEYELIKDYKNGFDLSAIEEKLTDYFAPFDYVIGDWSYGKLRLKGFCEHNNPIYREINDIANKDRYIQTECSYECRYFIIKKCINER